MQNILLHDEETCLEENESKIMKVETPEALK